jgi:hypothetical protein
MKPTDVDLRRLKDVAGGVQTRLTKTAGVAAAKATDLAAKVKAKAAAAIVERLPRRQETSGERDTDRYGDIDWDRVDHAVAVAAGLIATHVDILFVRIPETTKFFDTWYPGSPLTAWLHPDRHTRTARFFKRRGSGAGVPYDARYPSDTDGTVSGLRSEVHRLQSFGHDPAMGTFIGIGDLMSGVGTYVDDAGKGQRYHERDFHPVGPIRAVRTQARHLLSDFYTPAGVPPPLFSLLQVGRVQSPFMLPSRSPEPTREKVTWTHAARYMYVHGYDLRHFVTMALVPVIVEANIRGYWMLTASMRPDRDGAPARLSSMLLMGHTIALSGNLFKTRCLFGMNPTALNWAQMLMMPPATVAWIRASAGRDARIRRNLNEERERVAAGDDEPLPVRTDASTERSAARHPGTSASKQEASVPLEAEQADLPTA